MPLQNQCLDFDHRTFQWPGIFDQYDFENHPEAIYNMDETGVPLEPRPPKVIAQKGKKKV